MQFIWSIIAKFLSRPAVVEWLIARAKRTPYFHITGPDGSMYMERYWLFNPYLPEDERKRREKEGRLPPLRLRWLPSIRLHCIRREDQDRHLHDHPWNARTIILRGWYREVKPRRRCGMSNWSETYPVLREAGDTATLNFGAYHRIDEVPPDGVWTLFVTWKKRGTWGFLVDGFKVPWRDYLGVEENS